MGLANLKLGGNESSAVTSRFIREGESHVDELIAWLDESPERKDVAAKALSQIPSERGVSVVLDRFEDQPFDNSLANDCAKSSPAASRQFVATRLLDGSTVQKHNALLIAHHLKGYDSPQPGKEHPLLKSLLEASHDPDPEIRRESTQRISGYAYDAHYPEGRKALRRLVEMLRDTAPRVRSEACVQASQYPSPEVLELLKRIAANPQEDPRVLDSATRAAQSLSERLKRLSGMGQTPVYLDGKV